MKVNTIHNQSLWFDNYADPGRDCLNEKNHECIRTNSFTKFLLFLLFLT